MLIKAFFLMLWLHRGQKDKANKPYWKHPLQVALMCKGADAKVVALLHDVVEDAGYTLESVRKNFGSKIADALDGVTHRKGESYKDYVLRASKNPLSKQVKIADLKHNMNLSRLQVVTPKDIARVENKYIPALKQLLGDTVSSLKGGDEVWPCGTKTVTTMKGAP